MDFSFPLSFSDLVIISKRESSQITGNFWLTAFDQTTTIFLAVTLVAVLLSLWLISKYSTKSHGNKAFGDIATYFFGATLNQSMKFTFKDFLSTILTMGLFVGFPRNFRIVPTCRILSGFYCLMAMIVTTTFSGLTILTVFCNDFDIIPDSYYFVGIVVAKLLTRQSPPQIRNIKDLLVMDDFKILVKKRSFVEDIFMTSEPLNDLRHRVEVIRFQETDPVLIIH